jgi:hypothetical protein
VILKSIYKYLELHQTNWLAGGTMANITVMSWNLRKLDSSQVAVAGLPQALASIIVGSGADLILITELAEASGNIAMQSLANACNQQAGGSLYGAWGLSQGCGGERYGYLIRDLGVFRPLSYTAGTALSGTQAAPLQSLQDGTWSRGDA